MKSLSEEFEYIKGHKVTLACRWIVGRLLTFQFLRFFMNCFYLYFIFILNSPSLSLNLQCICGIIYLYLQSNMNWHHQILLLFSWPSVLLASKIIAAFKISVLHKWPPEGFLPKEFSFHGQLSSYASGRKTEPWHNYNTACSHCAVKGLDLILQHYSSLAALSVDSGSDCVGTILAGLGENEGTLLCAWWHCDVPLILLYRSSLIVLLKDSQSLSS